MDLELVEDGHDVVAVCVLITCLIVDYLAGAEGVIVGVSSAYRILEEGRGVVIDNDGCPDVFLEDGYSERHGVVVVHRRISREETKMSRFSYRIFGGLYHGLADQRCGACIWSKLTIKADDGDFERFRVLRDFEKHSPIHAHNA